MVWCQMSNGFELDELLVFPQLESGLSLRHSPILQLQCYADGDRGQQTLGHKQCTPGCS